MAAGRAVVVSPAVNIAGEIAEAGAGVVSKLSEEAFAGSIVSLLRDEVARARYAKNAREFARRYDWSAVGPQLAAMYEDARGRGRPRSSAGAA
jgi:glycosyltransferase involved in cell wall biosynthesis